MNIFVLDEDFDLNAQYHNDRHCVKMILEYAQLLSSALWMNNIEAPYKLTHKNHPCAIWTRNSLSNYIWLSKLALSLCKEYTYRYKKIHKTEEIIRKLSDIRLNIIDKGLTPFALAMPDEYKIDNDGIKSYRNYYIYGKKHLANWKNRDIPKWYLNFCPEISFEIGLKNHKIG